MLDDMKKQTGLKGIVNFFSANYNLFDISNMLDIHTCLMKET